MACVNPGRPMDSDEGTPGKGRLSMDLKEQAARKAVDLVQSGMLLGLGTGSTAALIVRELGVRLRDGRLTDIVGIPTSEATARAARDASIPMISLESGMRIDITLDGADEVDPAWNLIKGHGGSLLREKITAQASRAEVIVVDESKLVERLGQKKPLPVEVVRFGWKTHLDYFRSLGGDPHLRLLPDGTPFVTDEGNYTIDIAFPALEDSSPLADPHGLQQALRSRAGVIETGLFLQLTSTLVVGRPTGVEVHQRATGLMDGGA